MLQSFTMPVRVYYEDTDAGGVVYHANYLKFLERARTEWLRSKGIQQDVLLQQQLAFVVASMDCKFIRPVLFNQQINICTHIEKIGKTSIICQQTVVDCEQPEHLYFAATVKVGCVALSNFKPCRIPVELLQQINAE